MGSEEAVFSLVKFLIESGASCESARDTSGMNAIQRAAYCGNAKVVELLLEQPGVTVEAPEVPKTEGEITKVINTQSPLLLAMDSTSGDPAAVVRACLMAGADRDRINGDVGARSARQRIEAVKKGGEAESVAESIVNVFQDSAVMFWNASMRAFSSYSKGDYKRALDVYAEALQLVSSSGLDLSEADRARLH